MYNPHPIGFPSFIFKHHCMTPLLLLSLLVLAQSLPSPSVLQSQTPLLDIAILVIGFALILLEIGVWLHQRRERSMVDFSIFRK